MPHTDPFESRVAQHLPQLRRQEALVLMPQAGAHPGLLVLAEVEDQDPAAGRQDPAGFREGLRRIGIELKALFD